MRSFPRHLAALALLLATACQSDPPAAEPAAVPLPATMLAYTMFQPGSYWVYQDSVSRQLDSVWVVATDTSTFRAFDEDQNLVVEKYQRFTMRTRSSLGGPDLVYGVQRYCELPYRKDSGTPEYPCWSVVRGLWLPGSTADVGGSQVFPFAVPRDTPPVGYIYGQLQPYWHSQPLMLEGVSHPDVMEVGVHVDASLGGPAHYYWAPHIGIVRLRVRQLGVVHTQALVRFHTVQ